MTYKSGFIVLIGRPNAGKSTLLNQLLQHKVAIVSNKAQTTRNTIRGILTDPHYQLVYLDTPGVHKPQHEMGRQLNRLAFSSLEGVDLIYFLVDATKSFGSGDQGVLDMLVKQNIPIFLIVNKIDQVSKKELIKILLEFEKIEGIHSIIPISALTRDNIDHLIKQSVELMPEGEKLFETDTALDFPEHFYITEIIREHILHVTQQEIPHSVAVTLEEFKEDKKAIWIAASIVVERDSQKGIIIGKQGSMLKRIGTQAREELTKRLNKPIYLDILVKVDKDWRNNQTRLKRYLHKDLNDYE
jgi:GTP-binding protein Era